LSAGAELGMRCIVKHPRALAAVAAVSLIYGAGARTAFAQPAPPLPAQQWEPGPAAGADPPILPPPTPGAPISTSGTDVLPPRPAAAPAPVGRSGEDAGNHARGTSGAFRDLEARVAVDEARLETLENDLGPLRHLKVQGYVQFQYRAQSFNAQASPNLIDGRLPQGISSNDVIARSDGTTTNTNMFRLRRTRLRTIYETDVVRVFLQVDLLPAGGPTATQGTIARNAEATGIANWTKDIKTELIGGLFQIPFRAETIESSMYRPFVERSTASQQLFPSERDLGVHAKTFVKKDLFTIDVGILNGQRIGEKLFVLQPDLNGSKDFFATATSKLGPVTLNLAGYLGRGQTIDAKLLRLKNWKRLGANLGAVAAHPIFKKLGETKLIAELMFGTNMDTGVTYGFATPAIPPSFTDGVKDLNERGLYLRGEQELTRWALAGFRYDTYTTDSSVKNNARDTYTLMAGLRFSKLLRLINEASYATDNMHAAGTAAPSRHIYGYTAWVQGSFY
jgi:hypothetical protein